MNFIYFQKIAKVREERMTSKRVRELLSDLNRAISSFDSNDPLKKERENLIRERDVIVRYHGNVDDMCKDISKRIKRASRPVDSGKKNKKMGSEIQEIFRERDESLVMVQKRQSQVMDLFRAHKTLHGRCPAPPRTSNESYKQRVKDERRRLEESETKSRGKMEEMTKDVSKIKKDIANIRKKEDRQSKTVADLEKRLAKARKELKETKESRSRLERELKTRTETMRKCKNETETKQRRFKDKVSVRKKKIFELEARKKTTRAIQTHTGTSKTK